jgi:hypothetical protein
MMTPADADYKSVDVGRGNMWVMRRRGLRRAVGLGVVAAAAFALWRALDQNRRVDDGGWEPQPFPFPPQPRHEPAASRDGWVAPVERACPTSHPVKAKLRSGIFHEPGGASYGRTIPDRCYQNATAAEADGLRRAER